MRQRLQQALPDAWYRGAPWLCLLWPLEWTFRAASFTRRYAFRRGLRRSYRAPVPVVVIGNITLGGTGKTEVVIALVQALRERGIVAGVVSRGHGAAGSPAPRWVGAHSTARECGDEPLLIQRRGGCPCVVAGNRAAAVQALLRRARVDIVLSDDGLQHYSLGRDLEVVLYDAQAAFGNGHCLPAGPLREPLSRLAQADFVLSRGGAGDDADVRYLPEALIHLQRDERVEVSPQAIGREVYAVAGLGRPALFIDMLERAGFAVTPRLFPDHHRFRAADFAGLRDRPVIMTQKDAVKCTALVGDNAWFLRVSAQLPARLVDAVAHLARP